MTIVAISPPRRAIDGAAVCAIAPPSVVGVDANPPTAFGAGARRSGGVGVGLRAPGGVSPLGTYGGTSPPMCGALDR